MSIYVLLDRFKRPIAYHNKKKVIFKYYDSINRDDVYIGKTNKKPNDYEELYLVKYGSSYIPNNLLSTLEIMNDDEYRAYQDIINIIDSEIEFGNISKDDIKYLSKTVKYFRNKIKEIKNKPVSEQLVSEYKNMLESFRNRF